MTDIKTERSTLDTGDYSIRICGEIAPIRIERKGVGDLFGSFSGDNYQREKDKIARAKEKSLRYILAIEASCSEIRKGHQYRQGGVWHQVQKDGLSQVRQIETISMKYGVEIRYCSGREDMAFMVQEILMAYVRNYSKGSIGKEEGK
jgi:ERCC4-type nuclease